MLYSCDAIEFALENPALIDKEKFLSLGNLVKCISFDPTKFDRQLSTICNWLLPDKQICHGEL